MSIQRQSEPFLSEAELKELFIKHDANGDKRLSQEEVKNAFRELGVMLPNWRAKRALNFADANGDGFVTNDEINLLVHYVRRFVYKNT